MLYNKLNKWRNLFILSYTLEITVCLNRATLYVRFYKYSCLLIFGVQLLYMFMCMHIQYLYSNFHITPCTHIIYAQLITPDAFRPFMNSSRVSLPSWLLSNLRKRSLTRNFCWSTHELNLFLHASKLNDLYIYIVGTTKNSVTVVEWTCSTVIECWCFHKHCHLYT